MHHDTRAKLLEVAHELVMVHGFNNTGISHILKEADVPKGSFYHYFASKDDLGFALLDRFSALLQAHLRQFLSAYEGTALEALRAYFEQLTVQFTDEFRLCNCLLGNLGQELAIQHEGFRTAVRQHFNEIEQCLAQQFERAKGEGDLDPSWNSQDLARLLFSGWEGSLLRAKLEQSADHPAVFVRFFFGRLLA
ncbi:TetR/AcrR family transcriptional regulator [Deinococcus hopiensis]|uniref:Transcriptional regulator, TetR family n=1 Tax=Deinococcus hopiensis KR-140 TaxID=695939 RepID=A0A1W1UCX9_9DEIO|nr:TetR/AcrR family transcriptional regulator [Deinococcus hopiensis]SMB78958.1 transcriptional regulator, TetR family [Deinococcus hopiensis KR-140]